MPLVYCLPITSEGTNKPFRLSTMVAEVKGSTTHERRPSRGAPSLSRYAPAVRYVIKPVGGVPAVPTMLATLFFAIVRPSKSILLAMAATAGFNTRSLNISKDKAKSWVVNCVSTWNWVDKVTGTEVSLKSSTFSAGPVVPMNRPGRRTFKVLPILAPVTANWSSYSRVTLFVNVNSFSRTINASLVIFEIVSKLFPDILFS